MNWHPLMQFSSDWVSDKLKVWERHFAALKGTPCNILEVGSYEGRSACWFASHLMEHPGARMTCVDLWHNKQHLRTFDMNIALTGRSDQVSRLCGKTCDTLRTLRGTFDLIYIDAEHTACAALSDTCMTWPLLKKDGFVLFDDYKWNQQKDDSLPPKPGIDAFLTMWGASLTVLHKDWQVLVQKTGE